MSSCLISMPVFVACIECPGGRAIVARYTKYGGEPVLRNYFLFAALSVTVCAFGVSAQKAAAPAGPVFVNSALGGSILGYDIDQNGTEGLLSEYVALPGGTSNIATETFDQTTGQIIKIVVQQNNTHDDYVTLGV